MTAQEQNLFAAPPQNDWLYCGLVLLGIAVFIGLAESLRKFFRWTPESTRTLVHIGVGVLTTFTPRIFHSGVPAILLALIFIFVNSLTLRSRRLKGMHGTERVSYGTVFFPVAYLILVLLFWDREPAILILSMLVLAFGDSAAAFTGENNRSSTAYRLTTDKKSVEGSITMFVVSFITVFAGIHHFGARLNLPLDYALGLAFATALTATAWEALSSRGLDNLTVPVSSAFVMSTYIFPSYVNHEQLSLGVVFGLFVGVISYYSKLLAPSGAVMTFLLASALYGLGGWQWTVPILTFFLLSSFLSKVGRERKASLDTVFEKNAIRDYSQVAANGGVAGVLVLLSYLIRDVNFYPLYLGSVAAVTADTWGTEIGLLAKRKPRLVTSFKSVERGTNGAVTMLGLIGGAVGSVAIVLSAMSWIGDSRLWIGVVLAGLLGSLADTVLGATVQAQYRCSVCGRTTEKTAHCDTPTTLVRGYRWINNDAVNWMCAVTGAIAMLALSKL